MNDPVFWKAVLALAAPVCLYTGFRNWRLARLIDDTPRSRIRSAAQGYIELMGTAGPVSSQTLIAPLSGLPCVWWLFRIERQCGAGRNQRWETIEHGISDGPFRLADETGDCLVNPAGADVRPAVQSVWRGSSLRPTGPPPDGRQWLAGGDYRYTEHRINVGDHVSVIGEFRTLGGITATDVTGKVVALLADWKKDQPGLLRRFDTNGDGVLSQEEWERARAAARALIEQQPPAPVAPAANTVVRPEDGRPFLVAASDLKKLAGRSRLAAGVLLAGFLAAVSALAVLLLGTGAQ